MESTATSTKTVKVVIKKTPKETPTEAKTSKETPSEAKTHKDTQAKPEPIDWADVDDDAECARRREARCVGDTGEPDAAAASADAAKVSEAA